MANRILSLVLHILTISYLLVVVLATLKETIESHKKEMLKISIIENKLQ